MRCMEILSNDKNTSFSFITLRMLRNYEKRKDIQFFRQRETQIYKDYLQTLLFSDFFFGLQGYEACLIYVWKSVLALQKKNTVLQKSVC